MNFLSNYIKLLFKFSAFPSVAISLTFLFIDIIATVLSGSDPFRKFRINSVPHDLGSEKNLFTGKTNTAAEMDEERRLQAAMYQKTKNSLRR